MDPTAFATAYSLSTSIGLRPFLTLAIASLAMHFGYLHPSHGFAFMDTNSATILLAVLAVVEFAGDKIPVVDHTLHVLHIATKPIAAALLVGSVVPDIGPGDAVTYALMGAGAANALGIHTGVAALRGASTVTTAGFGNPIISFIEDGLSIVATALAFFAPFVAAAGAILLTIVILLVLRSVLRAGRRTSVTT
jgi:Domain of unknown function (DUF4126)